MLAVGSGGDVFPFVEVARALVERGLDATVLGPKRYRGAAERLGIAYQSIGAEDIFAEVFDGDEVWDPRKGTAASWRYYSAAARSGYERLREGWPISGTLLISSSFALAARLAEERDGYANTTVHLSPSVVFSGVAPPRWPASSIPKQWPVWLKRTLAAAAERFALDPTLMPFINPVRAELGLAPVRHVFSQWIHSPRRVVYAFPEWFGPPASDWPNCGEHADFPLRTAKPAALPEPLQTFLNRSDPRPVALVTAGTAVQAREGWMPRCVKGLRESGIRVVAVGPHARPQDSSADLLWMQNAPFEALFPRVQVVVHHGGVGTLAEALRAGTPQLLVPTAHDQFDNADRLQVLGLGSTGRADWAPGDFGSAVRGILASSSPAEFRQKVLARGVGRVDGAAQIAELALRP
ncbi:nucleotide disphospho-sugar-binding domain-containing protein [Inhella proteolytica]|uniref:Erythromycin biosynthesis protein CIII-like C-terminal domain-containing protein n=1 Tax=Inhella proteolytica TaxID=2795029 RepID=A0A931NJ62_9BURK|nr:nucleotide disphospho-sugar-binding domain-containing protein [Inhella proteolytica]MBH9578704.1 hypothetical protein [Inhella proteolytica]